jgi:uncharacterized protein YbjT (DUF2867 family)
MILVVGATGLLGTEICRRLRERGWPVRGLVRAGSPKEAALRELGVEIVHGDLRMPATVDAACRDCEAVISTATAMGSTDRSLTVRAIDHDGQLRLVESAKTNGVQTFVYVSVTPTLRSTAPLVRYKREVERAVRASGMRWSILQPTVFMEVWLGRLLGWDHVAGRAQIFGAGTTPVSWISVADVAEYAVRSLDDPRLADVDLPIAGSEMLSPNQVVEIFEQASGRPYRARRIPRALLTLLAPIAAFLDEEIASKMDMAAQFTRDADIDSPLQRDLALPLTTVREYAARVLRA